MGNISTIRRTDLIRAASSRAWALTSRPGVDLFSGAVLGSPRKPSLLCAALPGPELDKCRLSGRWPNYQTGQARLV